MSIITLTTDFGVSGYYVALLKGHILSADKNARIIDITHEVARYDIMEGAFFLKSTYARFPKGTIHLVCVNTYFDSKSRLILFKHDDYFFIGPNNGLFSLALPDQSKEGVCEIADQDMLDFYQVIGNAVQGISVKSPLSMLGSPVKEFVKKLNLQPVVYADQIRATIMYVDHFGNVVVNLTERTFKHARKNRQFALYYKSKDPITQLSKRYNSVPLGDVCAFFNSVGLLEIAVHMGNAHELLNLNKNETIQIDFFLKVNMIKRVVRMKFRKDSIEEFIQLFESVKSDIRAFEGCRHLELLQDVNDPSIIFTLSHWTLVNDLEKYRNSVLFKRRGQRLNNSLVKERKLGVQNVFLFVMNNTR